MHLSLVGNPTQVVIIEGVSDSTSPMIKLVLKGVRIVKFFMWISSSSFGVDFFTRVIDQGGWWLINMDLYVLQGFIHIDDGQIHLPVVCYQ